MCQVYDCYVISSLQTYEGGHQTELWKAISFDSILSPNN